MPIVCHIIICIRYRCYHNITINFILIQFHQRVPAMSNKKTASSNTWPSQINFYTESTHWKYTHSVHKWRWQWTFIICHHFVFKSFSISKKLNSYQLYVFTKQYNVILNMFYLDTIKLIKFILPYYSSALFIIVKICV